MRSPDDNKYYVIEAPYEGIDEYVCIPWTWIVSRTGDNVVVSYPVENPSVTEKRVKVGEGTSKEWKSYKSIVRYPTKTYNHAKSISTKMNDFHYKYKKFLDMKTADHESSASVERTTHRSEQSANSSQNIDKPLEFVVSSKNDDRSATKTRLKRMPQSNPETEAALKRSKLVEPAEPVSEVTEQSCQAFECPNENSSLEPITIADPELFTVLFTLLRDLHKSSNRNHSLIDMVRETLIMNDKVMKEQAKIIDELRASLASKGTTAVVEKIFEKNNKKQKEQDDGDDDDDHEVVNNKRYRKPKIVLPPEYNENDSRWTLRHRELAPGLVELMPHTSVYINAVKLIHCKKYAKNCRTLARMLSLEIFTKNALSVCSLTGEKARAFHFKGAFVRPGLDENARIALLDFVEEYRRKKGWKSQEHQSTHIKDGIRNLMKQIRMRYR